MSLKLFFANHSLTSKVKITFKNHYSEFLSEDAVAGREAKSQPVPSVNQYLFKKPLKIVNQLRALDFAGTSLEYILNFVRMVSESS